MVYFGVGKSRLMANVEARSSNLPCGSDSNLINPSVRTVIRCVDVVICEAEGAMGLNMVCWSERLPVDVIYGFTHTGHAGESSVIGGYLRVSDNQPIISITSDADLVMLNRGTGSRGIKTHCFSLAPHPKCPRKTKPPTSTTSAMTSRELLPSMNRLKRHSPSCRILGSIKRQVAHVPADNRLPFGVSSFLPVSSWKDSTRL